MPDAAVIQQNYGEDDTESNLVTDKLDEERVIEGERRTRDIPKMSYAAVFGGSIIPPHSVAIVILEVCFGIALNTLIHFENPTVCHFEQHCI